jgi:hypothetical protein
LKFTDRDIDGDGRSDVIIADSRTGEYFMVVLHTESASLQMSDFVDV